MIINNVELNGKIVNIKTVDGVISEISESPYGEGFDGNGDRIIPGLIDVHSHGMLGMDTMDADFEKMCLLYAKAGTTSFLPTTMTMDYESLDRVCEAQTNYKGANILGFHFEGPYVSKKYKGAQNEEYIKNPSAEEFSRFKNVKMITVAPELPGSMEFIKEVSGSMVVSLGHTDCDYETAIKAIEAGANCLTHTFNAMAPLHHRNVGPIGAGIEKHIYAQVICDGFHISKPMVMLCYRMFGADKMVIISDSIRPAKLPEGEYESGGLKVRVKDNAIRLLDGVIAGSYATLFDCFKKALEFGIPLEDVVRMTSTNAAEMLGIKKGKIKVGYDSDFIILDKDNNIKNVFIGEEKIV